MPRSITVLVLALPLAAACARTPEPVVTPDPKAAAAPDPRDVTRPDDPPPRYRPGSQTRLMPITMNAYGAYSDAPKAPQLGDVIDDFSLPLVRGGTWSLAEAAQRGKVVIVFYRGFW
jgi:hypothetical protein